MQKKDLYPNNENAFYLIPLPPSKIFSVMQGETSFLMPWHPAVTWLFPRKFIKAFPSKQ